MNAGRSSLVHAGINFRLLASVAALTRGIVGPHYAASKAALHGLAHHFASRVASDGVTVNAIAAALIDDTGTELGPPEELAA